MRTGRRLQTCHLERLGFDNLDARALLDRADAARNGVDTVEGTSEDEVFVLRQGSYAVCVEDRPNAVQALHVSRMRAASDPRGAAGLTGIRLVVDEPSGLVDDEKREYRRLSRCHPALTVSDDGGREKTACWTQLRSSPSSSCQHPTVSATISATGLRPYRQESQFTRQQNDRRLSTLASVLSLVANLVQVHLLGRIRASSVTALSSSSSSSSSSGG